MPTSTESRSTGGQFVSDQSSQRAEAVALRITGRNVEFVERRTGDRPDTHHADVVAHGDEKTSKVIGRRIGDLPVIEGAYIAAIVRDLDRYEEIRREGFEIIKRQGHVVIAHKDVVIQKDDHVVVFCQNRKVVKKVEQLFAVSVGFL